MYEQVFYEKPFLSQVIARIDFLTAADALQKSVPPQLAGVISHRFPIFEPTEALTQEFQFRVGEGLTQKQSSFKQWNYYGKEREKQCGLAPGFVFVACNRYSKYEDLKADFSDVVTALGNAFPDARAGRFGLRYINNIEVENLTPPVNWGEYIGADLLGMSAFSGRSDHLIRLMHTAEFKYEDLNLRFQFGMPNPDYPAVIKRPLFVLDLDGYVQAAHEIKDSLAHMDEAHRNVQDLFEKSITDNLRERMRVRTRQTV